MKATLLIEIGVEELPPNAMRALADAFADGMVAALDQAGVAHGPMQRFATPRRLAVAVEETAEATEPVMVEKFGPTVDIAFDDAGEPTRAAEGFARSVGSAVADLECEDSEKGPRLVYRGSEPGQPLSALVQRCAEQALRGLPIPKLMRWGESEKAFVRPVHWIVALHGSQVLPLTLFDTTAGKTTYGHRFHHPGALELVDSNSYAHVLQEPGTVIADPDSRKRRVEEEIAKAARQLDGRALIDDALVEEVTALVEWPVGVAGHFDTRFLALPREVLISTLQEHQRYFPVEASDGSLMAGFITLANIESRDVAQVIAGNERVVRPRLADALFFWEQDQRVGLDALAAQLDRVTFQQSLGSLAAKTRRIDAIAGRLIEPTGAEAGSVTRAVALAKADLLTEMVGEFPDLQGIMGGHYARAAAEGEDVARALAEQYAPTRAGAPIAASATGRVLALADRLDTLAGIFAIGKRPSGDKDPFGLRRAALGVIRTIIEGGLSLDLKAELAFAIAQQPTGASDECLAQLWMFHMERLRGYYADHGIRVDRFEAVIANELVDLLDFDRRIVALDAFANHPQAATVGNAHKRIRNILRRNAQQGSYDSYRAGLFTENAEKTLAQAYEAQKARVVSAMQAKNPQAALLALAELAEPLDRFFDQVMVMADDDRLRENRLALLDCLDALCREVADLSCLALE